MANEIDSAGRPRLYPWLLLCSILALCVDFGRFHANHNGDTLVPVLSSLYRWTLFFWEQDRLGSLLPLLAMPVRHPLGNLLLQAWLGIFFALATFYLLPRYILRDRTWPVVGSSSVLAFFLFTPDIYRFTFMVGHTPWFSSLALGLGGLIIAERVGRYRTATGFLLLVLAHWVHLGAFTLFIPLVLARGVLFELNSLPLQARDDASPSRWKRIWKTEMGRQFILLCLSTIVGFALSRISRYHYKGGSFGFLALDEWLSTWVRMSQGAWAAFQEVSGPSWPVILSILASLGAVWALCRCYRPTRSYAVRACLVLGAAGVANALVVGSMKWVKLNDFDPRYWTATVILFQAALVIIAFWPVLSGWSARVNQRLALALAPVLAIVTIAVYGLPSATQVRADLDQSLGKQTRDIIASGSTHVFGDYWDVWPAVYHANLTLYEQGSSRMVWGVTVRSWPTRKFWIGRPADRMRFAQALQPRRPDRVEDSNEVALRYLSVPQSLVETERRETIRILQLQTRSN